MTTERVSVLERLINTCYLKLTEKLHRISQSNLDERFDEKETVITETSPNEMYRRSF